MAHRASRLLAAAVLIAAACGAPGSDDPTPTDDTRPLATADPYARGYTDEDFPRLQELAEGVYSYEQLRSAGDERFTTVSLFVVTDEGVLVADGQGSVEETQRMLDHIATVTDQPVRTLVIGSDHGDHTAGNSAFPDGIEVLAHPTSAAALEASARAPDRSPDSPPVLTATRLVEETEVVTMAGREVHVMFLGRAHTGGDLVVYLPDERILFMSEAYLHRVFPAMRTAYPSEWVAMIERAQAMDVDLYVPGHGFVDPAPVLEAELEAFQEAIRAVIAEGERLHHAGVPLEEAQQSAAFGALESWSLRSSQGARAIQQVYAELDGTLPERTP